MEIGLSWVKDYQSKGPKNPKTPETLFRECYKRYPELYPTRMRVIDHVFFVIGNGYDWVDGEIICTSLDDYGTWGKRNRVNEGWEKRHQEDVKEMKKYLTLRLKMAQESGKPLSPYEKNRLKELEERDLPRPLPDPVGPVRFYPACEYSKIACVPDNVRPEWLSLAYEVAKILRDRSGVPENYEGDAEAEKITQERNREFGGKIVTDLESRFPQLIQQA